MILSIQNPKIQWIRRLQSRSKERRGDQVFVIEGVRLLEEALESQWETRLVIYSEELGERGMDLIRKYQSLDTQVEVVSSSVIKAISDTKTPQGILAVLPMRKLPIPKNPDLILILDQIREPGNLGTILRSAAAVGVQMVYLTEGTVDPYSPKVLRGGMGAHFRLPIQVADWKEICILIEDSKLYPYLASANRGDVYHQADFMLPMALIVGGEAHGAGEEAHRVAEALIHIPMPGGGESLNASVAAGILLFEVARQRGHDS